MSPPPSLTKQFFSHHKNYLTNVTKNKKVQVEFPVLGKTMDAKIRQAGNFINPANRTFKVEIAVPNTDNDIKPNLTAKLKINDYTNEKAVLIPQSIISENENGDQITIPFQVEESLVAESIQGLFTELK